MTTVHVHYQGEKHCEALHEASGSRISTDAPKDNKGLGEAFSPTDLVGTALASCILTTMAIMTEPEGLVFAGAWAKVKKEMSANPRRIAILSLELHFSKSLFAFRERLEKIAHSCPVSLSLSPETQLLLDFHYDL